MNTKELRADLVMLPLKINEIFISNFSFDVHPSQDEITNVDLKNLQFSSSINILDDKEKKIQVSVRLQTSNEEKDIYEFSISCVGIYTWQGDTFEDKDIQNIYAWCVSIQISTLRQRIAQEAANSPYHISWYMPLALVKISGDII